MTMQIIRDLLTDQLDILRALAIAGDAGIYTNNVTPDADTIIADLDSPVWAGYADIATPSWSAIFPSGQEQRMTHPNISWVNPGPSTVDIYGWYQLDSGGQLIIAERFAGAPVSLAATFGIILGLIVRQRSIP